uniref:Uncharacterized protein n=2 Tax=Clastoptera arizonana TaxID=38151 RepID=A0A1B6D7I3_9HEMI
MMMPVYLEFIFLNIIIIVFFYDSQHDNDSQVSKKDDKQREIIKMNVNLYNMKQNEHHHPLASNVIKHIILKDMDKIMPMIKNLVVFDTPENILKSQVGFNEIIFNPSEKINVAFLLSHNHGLISRNGFFEYNGSNKLISYEEDSYYDNNDEFSPLFQIGEENSRCKILILYLLNEIFKGHLSPNKSDKILHSSTSKMFNEKDFYQGAELLNILMSEELVLWKQLFGWLILFTFILINVLFYKIFRPDKMFVSWMIKMPDFYRALKHVCKYAKEYKEKKKISIPIGVDKESHTIRGQGSYADRTAMAPIKDYYLRKSKPSTGHPLFMFKEEKERKFTTLQKIFKHCLQKQPKFVDSQSASILQTIKYLKKNNSLYETGSNVSLQTNPLFKKQKSQHLLDLSQ